MIGFRDRNNISGNGLKMKVRRESKIADVKLKVFGAVML